MYVTEEQLAAPDGSSLVGFIQSGMGAEARTVQDKLREVVSPLDFGSTSGDGVTDAYAAITAAIATGKDVVFPKGYTFLTAGNHIITTPGQRITIAGTIRKKAGTQESLFVVNDVEGVTFDGNGTLDGNRAAFSAGNVNSGVTAYRAANLTIDGPKFESFKDCGLKLFNCPNTTVTRATRFHKITNMGIEIKSRVTDPRTPGVAWVGAVEAPSGAFDGYYDWIDDGLNGVGNGCGIDFCAAEAGALAPRGLVIRGIYRDCLRAIWSECHFAGSEAFNVTIDSPSIEGNYRGPATVETKDGIGLIGVKNWTINTPKIRNVGNFTPDNGGTCSGIYIGESYGLTDGGTIIAPEIIETSVAAARTDSCIDINSGSNIAIIGGDIGGASGLNMRVNTDPLLGTVTNLKVVNLKGAEDASFSWAGATCYTFRRDNLGAGLTAGALFPDGMIGADDFPIPAAGRIVGVSVRLSESLTTGAISFQVYGNNSVQTALNVTQADIGIGGVRATRKQSASAGTQLTEGQNLMVLVTTDSSFQPATMDALVRVYVDHGMKK
jgi:hypothetical protein